jgi:hypothetical protein
LRSGIELSKRRYESVRGLSQVFRRRSIVPKWSQERWVRIRGGAEPKQLTALDLGEVKAEIGERPVWAGWHVP